MTVGNTIGLGVGVGVGKGVNVTVGSGLSVGKEDVVGKRVCVGVGIAFRESCAFSIVERILFFCLPEDVGEGIKVGIGITTRVGVIEGCFLTLFYTAVKGILIASIAFSIIVFGG